MGKVGKGHLYFRDVIKSHVQAPINVKVLPMEVLLLMRRC